MACAGPFPSPSQQNPAWRALALLIPQRAAELRALLINHSAELCSFPPSPPASSQRPEPAPKPSCPLLCCRLQTHSRISQQRLTIARGSPWPPPLVQVHACAEPYQRAVPSVLNRTSVPQPWLVGGSQRRGEGAGSTPSEPLPVLPVPFPRQRSQGPRGSGDANTRSLGTPAHHSGDLLTPQPPAPLLWGHF